MSEAKTRGPRLAVAGEVQDRCVQAFALWTLCANAVVLSGGSLNQLLVLAGVVLCAFATGIATWITTGITTKARRTREPGIDAERGAREARREPEAEPDPRVRFAVAAAGIGLALTYGLTESVPLLWAGVLAIAAFLFLRELSSTPSTRPAVDAFRFDAAVLVASVALALLALCLHHPDIDDAFYLNLAAYATDHPSAALLAHDTLHGRDDIPLVLPIYRIHSLELLAAAFARITGLPAPTLPHLLLPPLVAFALPLALARALRLLAPRRWPAALGFALLFLLVAGESPNAYGSLALPRFHQGKAAALTLLLPLLIVYGLEFGRDPTPAKWWRLAAGQVAALGLSASSLWLAPTVSVLAVAAATPLMGRDARGQRAARTLALAVAASAYLLGVGLALQGPMAETFRGARVSLPSTEMGGADLAREAVRYVLWVGPLTVTTLVAVLLAWSTATTSLLRRLVAAFLFAFAAVFWNPFLAAELAAGVTGAPTYWRVFWILPTALLVGATFSAPLELARRRGDGERGAIVALAMCGALAVWLWLAPAQRAVSQHEGQWLGAPRWRVPPDALAAARALADAAPDGAFVLAPLDVSPWIAALHRPPKALVVRKQYFPLLATSLGEDELNRRVELARMATGLVVLPHARERLREAVADYPLAAVCLAGEAADNPVLRDALEDAGLQSLGRFGSYEVWGAGEAEGS